MKFSPTAFFVTLVAGVGIWAQQECKVVEARIARDDALHILELNQQSAIGGGGILSSSTPPSFFLSAELVQKPKSGAGKPVTTKKAQEDRTVKKGSGAKSPVIAKKGVRRSGPPPSTRSFENWKPCTLSTYWEWENGRSTASGVPFDDDGLTVAVHNGSRRALLNHHIEIRYGKVTVTALVTDVFIRWDLKDRLDCSPRLKHLLTGERGGLSGAIRVGGRQVPSGKASFRIVR